MYLSMLIGTQPIVAANNRGQGEGNNSPLQTISTGRQVRTVLSGYSLRYAIRDALLHTDAEMWRKHHVRDEGAGYGYGPNGAPTMAEAMPSSADQYDDTILFGFMAENASTDSPDSTAAPKKGKKDSKKNGMTKTRSTLQVSPAISLTPFVGDKAFVRGLSSTRDVTMPFTYDRHATRYQYTLTVNLDKLAPRPTSLRKVLDILPSLEVGGNHTANASSVNIDKICWRLHRAPGQGALSNSKGFDWMVDPEDELTTTALEGYMARLGIDDLNIETEVAAALDRMWEASKPHMGL